MQANLSRRSMLRGLVSLSSAAALAACQPKVVEKIVKETVIVQGTPQVVEKVVKETVVVSQEKVVEKVITNTPAPAKPIELVHFERNTPQDVDFRKELAVRFHEQYPNITVKIEVQPEGYGQTVQARVASRTAGDVFRHGAHFGMGKFVLRGMFYSIDEFVDQDKYDLSVFFEGAVTANRMEGKLWALPVNGHPGWSGIYYIPEDFQEAGVAEPTDKWTYDDVVATGLKLTKDADKDGKTDFYGYWQNGNFAAHLTPLSAFGGWTQDDAGVKATYDTAEAKAAIQWINDAYNKHKISVMSQKATDRLELWGSGKVAMIMSGLWDGAYLRDATPKGKTMKLVPGPFGPSGKRGGGMGVNNFPIWRSSEHPYEAWQWMKFICTKEVGVEDVARIGEPGLRHDVLKDPKVANDPMIAPLYELLMTAKPQPEPANSRTTELRAELDQLLPGIWLQELTVEEGMAKLQEKTQEIMNMPKPGMD